MKNLYECTLWVTNINGGTCPIYRRFIESELDPQALEAWLKINKPFKFGWWTANRIIIFKVEEINLI